MPDKKIIIIGASSGIGRALANIFLEQGYRTAITGRRNELLEQLSVQYPHQCVTRRFDVTDSNSLERHLDELATSLGGVDIIVISAGRGEINHALELPIERRMIDLNVLAFTTIAGWSFRRFEQQGGGQLVAITSIAGLRGNRQSPGYGATKAFQVSYLQGLRQKAHASPAHITVTDIRPGFVDTPMAQSPVKFWVAPVEKAARQIFSAIIKKRKVAYITRRWRIAAWLFRALPGWLHERL